MKLRARGLGKSYVRRTPLGVAGATHRAFHDVDVEIDPATTVGLVGPSGAGKSSLGRCLAFLERPDAGNLTFDDRDVTGLRGAPLRDFRRRVQFVHQDAVRALNPRWSAQRCLDEPLGLAPDGDRLRGRLVELTGLLGLDSLPLDRTLGGYSGGQLRRLNLLRALSLNPAVLILDEPFAGLDPSLQAQIANLLLDVQRLTRVGLLLISHDLMMLEPLVDELVVMDRGSIVERGPVRQLFADPRSLAGRRLVDASSPL